MRYWFTTLENRVHSVVEGSDDSRWPHTQKLLRGLSSLYGLGVRLHTSLYSFGLKKSRRLPCKVISVGNLTVGGTGKTPMTLYLAELVRHHGLRVAIVSRGYGGRAEKRGGVVSDGRQLLMTAADAGDEPFLMAVALGGVPVLVGRDRWQTGQWAIQQFGAQVLILDDGYQHLKIDRDLNILLMDSRHPQGTGRLLPSGPLREPLRAIHRADTVVLTRSDPCLRAESAGSIRKIFDGPLFCAAHRPKIERVVPAGSVCDALEPCLAPKRWRTVLHQKAVLAFSGLARNASFSESVTALGGKVTHGLAYPDHHRFGIQDWEEIQACALQYNCDCLATSTKDYARMPQGMRFPLDLVVIGVDIDFGDQAEAWEGFILHRLELASLPLPAASDLKFFQE